MERVSSIDGTTTGREVFALTDEQIMGMEPEGEVARGTQMTDEQLLESAGTSVERGAAEGAGDRKAATEDAARRDTTEQAQKNGAQAPHIFALAPSCPDAPQD